MEICVHDEYCGGCVYQGIPYEEQIRIKDQEVKRLLKAKDIQFEQYLGAARSPKSYRYRNKMEYTFGDMVKNGEMTLGMHQKKRFMSIVTVNSCQLVDEDFNLILDAALHFCKEKGYLFYNKKTHSGFLRHLIIRKGEGTGELLVNLVTSSQGNLDKDEFIKRLLDLKLNNGIVGILNTIDDGLADSICCEHLNVLWGRDYYMERILDLDFKVSAFSFFQTNIAAVERLYQEAIGMIDDLEGKTVFDLYCGTGTISQVMAKKAKSVIGVEIVQEAASAARENAALNGLKNCDFIAGDVFEALRNITEKPDVIVLDPPRVGIHPKALDQIIRYDTSQIVYISCNPKTLVENLYYLQYNKYKTERIKTFDNFPFTKHIECVALLKRENA